MLSRLDSGMIYRYNSDCWRKQDMWRAFPVMAWTMGHFRSLINMLTHCMGQVMVVEEKGFYILASQQGCVDVLGKKALVNWWNLLNTLAPYFTVTAWLKQASTAVALAILCCDVQSACLNRCHRSRSMGLPGTDTY